jgi:hypothetical protein
MDEVPPFSSSFPKLYELNKKNEYFVVIDVLNTILVIMGVRKAYLPMSKAISNALVSYFPLDVEILDTPFMPELSFIVKAKSGYKPPMNHIEVGKLLGYPCADEWVPTRAKLFYEIVAVSHSGAEVILFSFQCKTEKRLREAQELAESVASALQEEAFSKKYVKTAFLRKGTINERGDIVYAKSPNAPF